jgi:hypothetical protein
VYNWIDAGQIGFLQGPDTSPPGTRNKPSDAIKNDEPVPVQLIPTIAAVLIDE